VYADVHNTRLTYTPAHAWCPKHRSKCMHTLRKKCICARACAHMQRCRSFSTMKLLRTYLESCASIVQAVFCRPPSCRLDEISCLTLFAQEIRPNPRYLMTQSSLRCRTSIIRSSAFVRASSSLSMVHTRAWPRTSPSTKFYFRHGFRGLHTV